MFIFFIFGTRCNSFIIVIVHFFHIWYMMQFVGADMNKAADCGGTPLGEAARGGHGAVVKVLIAAGADVNKAEDYPTPLQIAVANDHEAVVKLLIAAGADVNKADNFGETPLGEAVMNDHEAVVKALIAAGADVNKASLGII